MVKPTKVRWNSMFDAIERAILLREAITEFTRRASSEQLRVEQRPEDAEEAYSNCTVDTWELTMQEW